MTNKSLIISQIKVLHVLKIKLIRIPLCNTPTRRSNKEKSLNLKLLLSQLQFYSSLSNSLVYFNVFSLYYLPALHQSHSNIDYSLMLYQGAEDSDNIAKYLVLFRRVIKRLTWNIIKNYSIHQKFINLVIIIKGLKVGNSITNKLKTFLKLAFLRFIKQKKITFFTLYCHI